MIRIRKYRIFLFVTALCLFAVYYYGRDADLGPTFDGLKGYGSRLTGGTAFPLEKDEAQWANSAEEQPQVQLKEQEDENSPSSTTSSTTSSSSTATKTSTSKAALLPTETLDPASLGYSEIRPGTEKEEFESETDEELEHGIGRLEKIENPRESDTPRWTKPPVHFPIPSASFIPLPTIAPKTQPRIQAQFKAESEAARTTRLHRLDHVKTAFNRTWTAYRKYAWMHDELKPVTAGYPSGRGSVDSFRDPFGGWAATLVDSLDTLWIMGMQDEFDEAVEATHDIDFTICLRNEIPVFETTIRYLGGLVGAYDVSGRKYQQLLDKAVELAEILIGAFDTPNHMPIVYYPWKPEQMKEPKRAGTRVVMAEIGSLSVEFTRLAQLTKDDKYYDAVARVTNELEKFQGNTSLPGLWPIVLDASGCSEIVANTISEPPLRLGKSTPSSQGTASTKPGGTVVEASDSIPDQKKDSSSFGADGIDPTEQTPEKTVTEQYPEKDRSSFGEDSTVITRRGGFPANTERGSRADNTCVGPHQALRESDKIWKRKFSLGAMADSTYEYLTKEYLLLGGANNQYRSMFTNVLDTVDEYLLYRPLVEDKYNLLFTGSFTPVNSDNETGHVNGWFEAPTGHLNCFVGGFYALGAKVFDLPDYLETAKKLTDGCVWQYVMTATGIGAEEITPAVCKNRDSCPWDEKEWHRQLIEKAATAGTVFYNQLESASKQSGINVPGLPPASTDFFDNTPRVPEMTGNAQDVTPDTQENTALQQTSVEQEEAMDSGSSPGSDLDLMIDEAVGMPGAPPLNAPTTLDDFDAVRAKRQLVNPLGNAIEDNFAGETTFENLAASEGPVSTGTPTTTTSADEPVTDYTDLLATGPATPDEVISEYVRDSGLWPGVIDIPFTKYILRPEAIESVFYMYRITGDEGWRTKGWDMFQAIEEYTRTDVAYSAIDDVTHDDPMKLDQMESFWTAETLKYFYLLFSDPSVISLDDFVLNTEAHPLLRPDASTTATQFEMPRHEPVDDYSMPRESLTDAEVTR